MATRLYGVSPGETEFSVTEGAGSAVSSDKVELTVELATTAVNTASGTRAMKKQEVLDCIEAIKNHILKDASGKFG